jgi:GNAT superfamily N-acetyltransferase
MIRRPLLLALAALLAAAAGVWLATRPAPPSDEALILALVDEAARAAEARRPAEAVAGVSEAFQGQGLGRRELQQLVAANALRGTWVAVKVVGARAEVDGDAATARLALVLSRGGPGTAVADLLPSQASAWRVTARLRREPAGWRVVGATWAQVPLAEALAADAPR